MHAHATATALRGCARTNALAVTRCERWRPSRERSASASTLHRSNSGPPKRTTNQHATLSHPSTSSHSLAPPMQSSRVLHIPATEVLAQLGKPNDARWPWSSALLGCGAAAAVAAVLSASSSTADATLTEAAAAASDVQPPLPSSPSSPAHKALRKRKTSTGNERFVVSSAAVRGDRETMEDASFVSSCKRFAAVFDGHGGAGVAEHLRQHLFARLAPSLATFDAESATRTATAAASLLDPTARTDASARLLPALPSALQVVTPPAKRSEILTLLKTALEQLDADVAKRSEWRHQGATAVAVLLLDDVLYTLNVGDCRAVLCRSGDAVELTRDHKPNDPREQSRIESLGGRVEWHGYVDANGEPIEPYGAYRINGNLAVARAVGDRDLRPFVSGEPEVAALVRDDRTDEFVVLASDGLWDVFTSDEVVTFVHDVMSGELGGRESWRSGAHSDTRVPIFEWSHQYTSDRGMIKAARKRRKLQIANYLVQEALYRGTSDNVSVIVVWLR